MEKPKVLIFTTSYHPFVGGAEIAVKEICERLKDRFDFFIVTSRFKRDLPKVEKRPEGQVIRLGWGSSWDKWFLPLLSLIYSYKGSVSIVVGVDISQGALAAALYKFFHPRTRFILNIQYGYGDERLADGRLGAIRFAFKLMLKQTDFVTAISSYLLETARKYGYQGLAEVVPNGVDIQKFKVQSLKFKSSDQKSRVVVTTSRLVMKNGIDTLIRAVAEVKKSVPDIQCWIVGAGPEKESYKLQVTQYQLEDNVKLLGEVPHEQIPEYLHRADIFVRPSRSEGMGNSFVEALAAGIPIIGTSVGGILDIIKDRKTGLFVKVDDAYDLAEKIKLLLKDENLSQTIVEEGKKLVEEKFSWDKIGASYGKLFDQYVKPRGFNILIATPLMPPQLGGPALYAKNLSEEFIKAGYGVSVLSFGKFLRYPSLVRHILYFFSLLGRACGKDVIISLDYFSVGFPAAVVSKILRIPLVLRMEGDFLWEGYVERTRREISLAEFYKNTPRPSLRDKIIWAAAGFVLRKSSRVSFSSEWRREMVVKKFRIPFEKTVIIKNVFPAPRNPQLTNHNLRPKVVLWAGRMIYLKNLYRLIRAFSRIGRPDWELRILGDGPEKSRIDDFVKNEQISGVKILPQLEHEKLLEEMTQVSFFAFPSFSDVGPNVIAESIVAGTPFLMTRFSGFYEYFKDLGVFVDPFSEKYIEEKMRILMDDAKRAEYRKKLDNFTSFRSWEEAAKEWLGLLQEVTS